MGIHIMPPLFKVLPIPPEEAVRKCEGILPLSGSDYFGFEHWVAAPFQPVASFWLEYIQLSLYKTDLVYTPSYVKLYLSLANVDGSPQPGTVFATSRLDAPALEWMNPKLFTFPFPKKRLYKDENYALWADCGKAIEDPNELVYTTWDGMTDFICALVKKDFISDDEGASWTENLDNYCNMFINGY